MESKDEEETVMLSGQLKIWQLMFGFVDSMALKCAVELGLADIIHSRSTPLTLSQIASGIDSSSPPNTIYLERIMRFLAFKEIFSVHYAQEEGGETLYGSTQNSRWLLRDKEPSIANHIKMQNHPYMLAPWQFLAECVRDGDTAFNKAHGCKLWELASKDGEFGRTSREAGADNKMFTKHIISHYKDGFNDIGIGTMVDVGGGDGVILAEIVKAYPHIKGINFDLPYVVDGAPAFDGVSHVAGSMFEAIPDSDAIFIKGVLHNWSDEDCIKILKNCRKAIPEKTGRLIIVDIILQTRDGDDEYEGIKLIFDLLMCTFFGGGKERTELEMKKLLLEAGFPRYKIIQLPTILSIVEAYPSE